MNKIEIKVTDVDNEQIEVEQHVSIDASSKEITLLMVPILKVLKSIDEFAFVMASLMVVDGEDKNDEINK